MSTRLQLRWRQRSRDVVEQWIYRDIADGRRCLAKRLARLVDGGRAGDSQAGNGNAGSVGQRTPAS